MHGCAGLTVCCACISLPQMSPELLPVLINALSEQGAFQQGGEPVPTTREQLPRLGVAA